MGGEGKGERGRMGERGKLRERGKIKVGRRGGESLKSSKHHITLLVLPHTAIISQHPFAKQLT